jgi:hypothetical protein
LSPPGNAGHGATRAADQLPQAFRFFVLAAYSGLQMSATWPHLWDKLVSCPGLAKWGNRDKIPSCPTLLRSHAPATCYKGNLIAGTDPGGLVLRIGPDGKAYTLFDSAQREVRELAFGENGEIFALTLAESAGSGASNTASSSGSSTSPSLGGGDEGGVTITISDVQVLDSPSTSASSASSSSSGSGAKAALYRLDASGGSEVLWDSKEAAAFTVALAGVADQQMALIGTGLKGRVYQVSAKRKPTMLGQLPEAQVSRLVASPKGLFAVTSNLGKVYRSENSSVGGTYISPVREAATGANWGRVAWLGEGAIELQTRSGNTGTPDSTWSDWSAAITNSDGDVVKSPAARFLQWRATLKRAAGKPEPSFARSDCFLSPAQRRAPAQFNYHFARWRRFAGAAATAQR